MSILWVAPLVVFAVGALLLLNALRETTSAAAALRDECAQLDQVRVALADLRTDADLTRQKAVGLRSATRPARLDR